MDILKEVGNTAAAHGSTALSEMLGRKIELNVPSVTMASPEEIIKKANIQGITMAFQTKILEGLAGESLYILLEEKSAYKLVDICYKLDEGLKKGSLYTEMSMSLMREIANVVTAAYMGALGYFLKKLLIPSLPLLINAPFDEIVKMVVHSHEKNQVLLIESTFKEPKEKLQGTFWLILTHGAVNEIQKACKEMLNNI